MNADQFICIERQDVTRWVRVSAIMCLNRANHQVEWPTNAYGCVFINGSRDPLLVDENEFNQIANAIGVAT